jgi:hypothetical protein
MILYMNIPSVTHFSTPEFKHSQKIRAMDDATFNAIPKFKF